MKYKLLVFALFYASVGFGQKLLITGKIINTKDSMVKISTWNGAEYEETFAKLKKDGKFKLIANAHHAAPYDFTIGNERAATFFTPGDSLYVTLDMQKFDETITWSGKGAAANNYLAKRYLHFEPTIEDPEFNGKYARHIAFDNTAGFVNYADSIMKVRIDYLYTFTNDLPQAFYDFEWADIVFKYTRDKIDYPMLHYYIRGIKDSTVAVEDAYYSFYNKLPVDNENHLSSYNFTTYLDDYVRYQCKKKLGRDSLSYTDMVTGAKSLLSGKIYQTFLAFFAIKTFEFAGSKEVQEMIVQVRNLITDSTLLAMAEKRYKVKSALFPGNPAPNFTLLDRNNKKVSLRDFRGKLVYIDFWASWCGPCRMEMPSSKKLQDSMKGKDVVFLFIDIDEDRKSWIKAMDEEKLGGVHVYAKGFENKVAKLYTVNGIPSYFLIGRDGKIIDNSPPRPSSENIVQVLTEALKKK